MTTFRLFILIFSILILACGPKEDSLEGRFIVYSKQVEDNPDNPEGHYELGKVYIEQKKYQAAINQFNKATRLKKDYGEAYRE